MSTSWVIKDKATGEVVLETFSASFVEALNTHRYVAVPILEYLATFNQLVAAARLAGGTPRAGDLGGLPPVQHCARYAPGLAAIARDGAAA